MVGMCVMILIKRLKALFVIFPIFLFSSCETLDEMLGLEKSVVDDSLFSETPELILPPDFNKEPKSKTEPNNFARANDISKGKFQPMATYPTVDPRITNFFSPRINMQSSTSPSDSLAKFKQNKKFTIGEWVYSQYVDGFKRGNIYYRPIYDKGYNFSRRYIPGGNVATFLPPQQQINNFQPSPPISNPSIDSSRDGSEFETFDQLPVLE